MADIDSRSNPKIKACKELHRSKGRARTHQTLVEGPKVFAEFVAAGLEPAAVFTAEDDTVTLDISTEHGFPHWTVSERALDAASDTVTAQSPVAVFPIPESGVLRRHNTVVLVDIADPGNVGTIVRSAGAFGWDVAYTSGTADPWSPKTIRSGAGSHARTRLIEIEASLERLRAAGLRVLATVVGTGSAPRPSSDPTALLIGSESAGLPLELVAGSDASVSIPTAEAVESLNAAVAASIAMYALV